MRARVSATAAFGLIVVMLSAGTPAHAQAPPPPLAAPASLPPPGFVSPYEIMRTVRAAGFDPLAPPLREGTTYVLRAYDFRGILMRVVVDARTGAIRDANRIVAGPGSYGLGSDGQLGMATPYEAPPDNLPPPYEPPPEVDAPEMTPSGRAAMPPATLQTPTLRRATRATGGSGPSLPLPRPRPAQLAARNPAPSDVKAEAKSGAKPDVTPGATPIATPVAPAKTPAVVSPLND